jgi:hypothetical protein
MRRVVYIIALGTVVLTAAIARAQTSLAPAIFDMKGTWKGNNEALVDGPATHHPAGVDSKPAGPYRLRQQMITYKFDGQDGKRFWGTMSSEQVANIRMLGTLSADNKWIYMVSKEGYLDGQIIDANTIEMCYRHANETSAVVGCNVMKRVK